VRRKSLFRVVDPFLRALGAICLVGIGVLIGVLIEGDKGSEPPTPQGDKSATSRTAAPCSLPRAARCATASRAGAGATLPASTT
jgi:hypothetical protein